MSIKRYNTILGLDISTEFIKIVELEHTSEGVRVKSFVAGNTPTGSIKEGVIVNPGAVSKTITTLLIRSNIQTKKAIASVRSPHALLRLSRLPYMSESQAELALQKEANQYTVFKGKEPVLDVHIVEEISEAGVRKMNVLFAVVTKELCNSYVKTAELAGLDLISIDISPLAILRALGRTNLKVSGLEATMLVAVNQASIDMCILKGDRIRFCHTVKVDIEEMNSNLDGFVDKIASAFRLVLNFYQAKYTGGEEISKMVLTCDRYPCLSLKERLGERLRDVSIEIGDSVGGVLIDGKRFPADKVEELASFTCAVGCALQAEGFSDYPVRFNLVPKEKFERLELTKLISLLNIMLGGVLGVFFILAAVLFINNKLLEHQIYNLQQKFKKPGPLLIKIDSIFKDKDNVERQMEERLLFLNKVSSSAIPLDRALVSATAKAPASLWLVRISSEKNTINIKGKAYSEEPIFKFIKSLDNSFYFTSAKLVSSQNIEVKGKEELEFVIVCNLRIKE